MSNPPLGLIRFNVAMEKKVAAEARLAFETLRRDVGAVSFQRFLGTLVRKGLEAHRKAAYREREVLAPGEPGLEG